MRHASRLIALATAVLALQGCLAKTALDVEVQSLSDDALKEVITEGHGKMKPVKTVAGKDVDDVIAYVRSLKK